MCVIRGRCSNNNDGKRLVIMYMLYAHSPLILTTPVGGGRFPPQFTDGETEAQSGSAVAQGGKWQSQALYPGPGFTSLATLLPGHTTENVKRCIMVFSTVLKIRKNKTQTKCPPLLINPTLSLQRGSVHLLTTMARTAAGMTMIQLSSLLLGLLVG